MKSGVMIIAIRVEDVYNPDKFQNKTFVLFKKKKVLSDGEPACDKNVLLRKWRNIFPDIGHKSQDAHASLQ